MEWQNPNLPEYQSFRVTCTLPEWKVVFRNLASCSGLSSMKAEFLEKSVIAVLSFDEKESLSTIFGLGTFSSLEISTSEYLQGTNNNKKSLKRSESLPEDLQERHSQNSGLSEDHLEINQSGLFQSTPGHPVRSIPDSPRPRSFPLKRSAAVMPPAQKKNKSVVDFT